MWKGMEPNYIALTHIFLFVCCLPSRTYIIMFVVVLQELQLQLEGSVDAEKQLHCDLDDVRQKLEKSEQLISSCVDPTGDRNVCEDKLQAIKVISVLMKMKNNYDYRPILAFPLSLIRMKHIFNICKY